MLYLSLKWLHIVAIISWMAGILYLYRLLVYHAEHGDDPKIHEFLVMAESKLYRIITIPAMVVSFVAGLALVAVNPQIAKGIWFPVKFVLVLVLAGATGKAGKLHKAFQARESNLPSGKRLRLLNEVPTLLMFIIVALVVFKPF